MAYLNGHELFFGVTATVGGGSIIGTPQAAQGDPKSLTVSTFELTYGYSTVCEDFLSGLPWEWDYTANGVRRWGNLVLRKKSNKLYFSNNYTNADMGSAIELTTGTVTVIKSSKAMLVLAPVSGSNNHPFDVIAVGTMKGSDGTEYKAMATDTPYSTSSQITTALDDTDNSALVHFFVRSGNYAGAPRTTTQTDMLIPLLLDNADISAVWEDVLYTAACADIHKTGLYTVGGSDYYYGYTLALKDGG